MSSWKEIPEGLQMGREEKTRKVGREAKKGKKGKTRKVAGPRRERSRGEEAQELEGIR